MRILYFSPRDCWPANTGARLRDFHLARQLSLRAEISYLGFVDRDTFRGEQPSLGNSPLTLIHRKPGYRMLDLLRGLTGPSPVSILNYSSEAMRGELGRILKAGDFDTIQIEGVHLFSYVDQIKSAAPHARLICDWHNIESELLDRYAHHAKGRGRRWYAQRTSKLMERCERQFLDRGDAHTVCSERERDILLSTGAKRPIHVVPNGVDSSYFSDGPDNEFRDRRDVVFVGSMDYHANIDAVAGFARDVWPIVRSEAKSLRFVIVGSKPHAQVRELGKQENIVVTGTVEDVRPFYRNARVVVAPLTVGSGTRLKLLEAMAAGVPVVSTKVGAEGLNFKPGEHILIADSPKDMAAAILGLEPGSPRWLEISASARHLVSQNYDWNISGAVLWNLHRDLSASFRNGAAS